MICPYCNANDDKVIDSRASDAGKIIRRRRECLACSKRFTTYERVEETTRLMVIKRDGSRVPFNRANVLKGVQAACGKRPIAEDAKERIASDVEEEIVKEFDREVPSLIIGQRVSARLKDLDEIAYVRFASEYHQFRDARELMEELRRLNERTKDVKDQQRLFGTGQGAAGGGEQR